MLIYSILSECMQDEAAFYELVDAQDTRRLRNIFHGNSMLPGAYPRDHNSHWRYPNILRIQAKHEHEYLAENTASNLYKVYQDAPTNILPKIQHPICTKFIKML